MNLLDAMRYLVALEQHRHFGRAARACHITQPALSNAMRALEGEFGVTVVRRGRQYDGLTPEGHAVLASAYRMLHEHEVLRQELQAAQRHPRGNLTIGAVPTATPIASRFAARLQARHPGVTPAVRSLSSAEIEAGIESLGLDVAFSYIERVTPRQSRITVVPQYTEHYYLLRRAAPGPGRTAAQRIGEPMRWKDAAAYPLCMLTPDMHSRSIVDAAFAEAGARVRPAIETNAVMMLVMAVLAGEVCTVMPGALVAIALQYEELEALPLIEPQTCKPIGLLLSTDMRRSHAQNAALALAQDDDWLHLAASCSCLPLDACL